MNESNFLLQTKPRINNERYGIIFESVHENPSLSRKKASKLEKNSRIKTKTRFKMTNEMIFFMLQK